jgi:hypothetical protein
VRWTHDPPTEEGYYWFRLDDEDRVEIAHFYLGREPPPGEKPTLCERPYYYTTGCDVPYEPMLQSWWWPVALVQPPTDG